MNKEIKYNPFIDGLRGLSILLILLFHYEKIFLNTHIFQGGFIGVDIFFVISGYLISKIIFSELKRTKDFSFKKFYLRRIKRILPVLIVVIIFCLVISYILFIPQKYEYSIKSIKSSWFFFSNIFFWRTLNSYYAEEATNIPLLHTWSLSVEEQFYIIFPLFVFLVYYFFKKRLFGLLIFIFIISILIATFASFYFPGANFYLLPSRAWELLAGSIISYIEVFKRTKLILNNNVKFLPFFCLILILVFAVTLDENSYHPSLLTLVPVGSTALLISLSRRENFLINKIIMSKLLIRTGLISYSLYLWHFPLFVFIKSMNLEINNFIFFTLIIFSLTFFTSILSYRFVERPIRNNKYNNKLLLIFVFCFSLFVLIFNQKHFDNFNFVTKITPNLSEALQEKKENLDNKYCFYLEENYNFCSSKKNRSYDNIDIVLLGDSVFEKMGSNLNKSINNDKYNILDLSRGGAFYTPYGRYINLKNGKDRLSEDLDIRRSSYFNNNKEKKIIIISAYYNVHLKDYSYIYLSSLVEKINPLKLLLQKKLYFDDGINKSRIDFLKIIKELINNKNTSIILIYPYPDYKGYKGHVTQSLHVKNFLEKIFEINSSPLVIKLKEFINVNKELIELMDSIKHSNLYRVYPQNFFCDDKNCYFTKDDKPIYYDHIHLTDFGATMINNQVMDIINKIRKKYYDK